MDDSQCLTPIFNNDDDDDDAGRDLIKIRVTTNGNCYFFEWPLVTEQLTFHLYREVAKVSV